MASIAEYTMGAYNAASAEPDYLNDPNYWGPLGYTGGRKSSSGEMVSAEGALALSTYFACLRNLAEDIAKLSCNTYEKQGKSRREATEHPNYDRLKYSPNPDMSAMAFWELLYHWAPGWGNAFAEIEWIPGTGRWQNLWPIHPSRVNVHRVDGQLVYSVYQHPNESLFKMVGPRVDFAPSDIFHLHGLGGDGITGYSIARIGCESIGRAMAIQKYSGAIFANGGMDRIALSHPGVLSSKTRDALREQWGDTYGGAANTGIAVLEQGMKVERFGIPPEDAQMIEASQSAVEDIASWFRMPLHKLQRQPRAQGWSTLDAQNRDYVTDTLLAWAKRGEQEIKRKLFLPAEANFYAMWDFIELLRGDQKAQDEHHASMFKIGVYNRDEIRADLDRNPVPDGEVYFIEGNNMLPASLVAGKKEEEKTVTDDSLTFKRDVLKALLADGTINDVLFNQLQGKQLMTDAGLPVTPEDAEPLLPVIASAGSAVTGEVLVNEAGETVGGSLEEPEEPEPEPGEDVEILPEGDPGEGPEELGEPGGELEEGPEGDTAAPPPANPFAAFAPLIEDAAERIVNAELRELTKRADKAARDRPRFNAWVAKFYVGHGQYVAKTLAPIFRGWATATGRDVDAARACDLLSSHLAATLTAAEDPAAFIREWQDTAPGWTVKVIKESLHAE